MTVGACSYIKSENILRFGNYQQLKNFCFNKTKPYDYKCIDL